MSELDVVKQQIAYLKVWLGIMVVTDISLFGWLASNFWNASSWIIGGSIFAIVAVSGVIIRAHRRIEGHIESLRRL